MDLQQPQWSLDDAYGSVNDSRFLNEFTCLKEHMSELQRLSEASSENAKAGLEAYLCQRDSIEESLSSLQAFCKCCISFDLTDTLAADYAAQLSSLKAELEVSSVTFEKALLSLTDKELADLLERDSIRHWFFTVQQKRNDWKQSLPGSEKLLLEKLTASNLIPLGGAYMQLANRMKLQVKDDNGEQRIINNAGAISILKGSDDAVLRESTFAAQNASIDNHKELYSNTLNAMAGFRLSWFEQAGVDFLTPSTQQNRLSNATLEAMMSALKDHRDLAQKTVRLRAPYLGADTMKVCDLLAPAPPVYDGIVSKFNFPQAMAIIKEALGEVDHELPEFVDRMVAHRWIEGSTSKNKIGGAFYVRFNTLKQPRVFSTFGGTLASITQQAHEIGHAWHYWIMRDLPVLHTEFPMTLTETASTFNENQVRDYLLKKAQSKAERFSMLWQELKTIANFLLNIPVRYEFEKRFLTERMKGTVAADRISQIMDDAWREWYGDSTEDSDRYFWASKLHFFKADQYIYNYPYSFGYLFSIGLLMKKEQMDEDFFPFYKALLRDTGRMTVEDLFAKHMGIDPARPEFWNQCIEYLAGKVDLFEKEFAFYQV